MTTAKMIYNIDYKDGSFDVFEMQIDEANAEEIKDIGAQIGSYDGKPSFLALANMNTNEILFVNLDDVKSIKMTTVTV